MAPVVLLEWLLFHCSLSPGVGEGDQVCNCKYNAAQIPVVHNRFLASTFNFLVPPLVCIVLCLKYSLVQSTSLLPPSLHLQGQLWWKKKHIATCWLASFASVIIYVPRALSTALPSSVCFLALLHECSILPSLPPSSPNSCQSFLSLFLKKVHIRKIHTCSSPVAEPCYSPRVLG